MPSAWREVARWSLGAAVAVLPFSAICAYATNHACTYVEAEVSTPEPGSPRYQWCSVVDPSHSWWVVLLVPALLAGLIALGLTHWRGWGVWAVAASVASGLAIWQTLYVSSLRPDFTIGTTLLIHML